MRNPTPPIGGGARRGRMGFLGTCLLSVLVVLSGCSESSTSPSEEVLGTTPGWLDGVTVRFDYTEDFFCEEPPSSQSPSGCEGGEPPQSTPDMAGEIPILYVMAPLFTPAPPAEELHCPIVGECITHPASIDMSRVLGPDAEGLSLPAHSHIVEEDAGGASVWWEIEVIGVTDAQVWNEIVSTPSLDRVRELQATGEGMTGDIPTNLFLRFAVR